MGVSLAVSLDRAQRDVRAAAKTLARHSGDPLRLDLPPDRVEGALLEPRAAAALGSLYLLSELEQVEVVGCAELLAGERYGLGVRDPTAAARLEQYEAGQRDRPPRQARQHLYARLFGSHWGTEPARPGVLTQAASNDTFEELLAGYCDAIAATGLRLARWATTLRQSGERLRANLAPRQYGNTLLVAEPLIAQLRDSLDLLALPGIAQALGLPAGTWSVVRALQPETNPDLGRHLDRGQSGRIVVASCGYPPVPDLVTGDLRQAAETWLAATGFADPAAQAR